MNSVCKKIWLMALVVLLVAWTGAPPEIAAAEKVLVVGDYTPINTLDPAASTISQYVMFYRNMFNSLLRYKFNSTEFEGDLAKSWTASKDGLVYTFKLKENIKWHKGFGYVTAQDVKFSFDRVLDPETHSPNRKELMEYVKEVKAVDDQTVQIHLQYPSPVFLYTCTRPRAVAIVSKKAVEKYGKDFARNPIGSGPFVLESFSREQIVLTANKEYHEGAPKIDRVIYKMIPDNDTLLMALIKGDIHMVHSISRDKAILDRLFAGGGKLQVIDKGTYHQLHLNPRYKPLEDIRVRRAVAYAIDRDAIIEHVTTKMGTKLNSPVPKGYWGHTEEGIRHYEYDPKKAKELLAEVGYSNGFEVTLDTFQSPTYLPVAIAIQGQLEKVGIKVKLEVKDQNTWMAKLSGGNSQMSLLFPTRHPDAHFPLVDFFSSAGFSPGLNLARYDKVDDKIATAKKEMDPQKRQKIYQEIQKTIMEDLPVVPLFMLPHPCAHSPKITGFPSIDYVWGYDFYNLRFVE